MVKILPLGLRQTAAAFCETALLVRRSLGEGWAVSSGRSRLRHRKLQQAVAFQMNFRANVFDFLLSVVVEFPSDKGYYVY